MLRVFESGTFSGSPDIVSYFVFKVLSWRDMKLTLRFEDNFLMSRSFLKW